MYTFKKNRKTVIRFLKTGARFDSQMTVTTFPSYYHLNNFVLFSVNLVPRALTPPWEEGCVSVELVLNWKNFELRSLLLSETTLKLSEIEASCAIFY